MENEMAITTNPSKRRIVTFRVVTTLLVLGMFLGGITVLFNNDFQLQRFKNLGYPLYLMKIIGFSKIIAAIVLTVRGIPLFKIAAYVGIFIVSVCAFISHVVVGDSMGEIINPLILTAMTLTACYLNPYIRFQR